MNTNDTGTGATSQQNLTAYPRQSLPPFNRFAIVAFVSTLVGCFPIAVVLGHFAKHRIRNTGERGSGLVAVSLAIGYFWLILAIGMFGALFSVPVLEWLGVFD